MNLNKRILLTTMLLSPLLASAQGNQTYTTTTQEAAEAAARQHKFSTMNSNDARGLSRIEDQEQRTYSPPPQSSSPSNDGE